MLEFLQCSEGGGGSPGMQKNMTLKVNPKKKGWETLKIILMRTENTPEGMGELYVN